MTPAFALYAEMSLEEIVQRADVGVVGSLSDVSKTAGWGIVHANGVIHVEEVLFGDLPLPGSIPVWWTMYPGVCGGNDFERMTGKRIWLVSTMNGIGELTWYGFLHSARKPDVLTASCRPLCARAVSDYEQKRFNVSLIYRNMTSATLVLPEIDFRDGRLILPAGASLFAKVLNNHSDYTTVTAKAGRVEFTSAPKMLSLPPGGTKSVSFNFADVFTDQFTNYEFRWSLPGYGISNLAYGSALPENHSAFADENPLWLNFMILLSYSPTREIIIGLIIGAISIAVYIVNRRKRIFQV